MKRIVAMLCIITMIFSTNVQLFAQTLKTTFMIESVDASAGESIDVPIVVSDNTGICGAEINLSYDEELILTKITAGDAFTSMTFTKPGNLATNPINLLWDSMDADYSNGTIAVLTFTAPKQSGVYEIKISSNSDVIDGNLNPVELNIVNGAVNVLSEEHTYSYEITKSPTETTTGILTGTCSGCSETISIMVPSLNMVDYTYENVKETTCEENGLGRYMWNEVTYGVFYFDVELEKYGHSYSEAITAPTCTEQGYSTYVCSRCEGSYIGNYTSKLGHSYENGICTSCGEMQPDETIVASGSCGDNATWTLDDQGVLRISGKGAMYDYDSLTIPWAAYRKELVQVVIEEGITTIGSYAFYNTSIQSINIPSSIQTIGVYAFNYCTSLEEIYISDLESWLGMTIDSPSPLAYAKKVYIGGELVEEGAVITIPDSITMIKSNAFREFDAVGEIILHEKVTSIGESAFSGCDNLKKINLPDSITEIGESAFSSCINLRNINLPDSITEIGQASFSYCISLESIDVPKKITRLSWSLFSGCTSLETVKLPENLTEIGRWAFLECESLTEIIIPKDVTFIGIGAFVDCYALKTVTFLGDAPHFDSTKMFDNVEATVYYPGESDTWTETVMLQYGGTLIWKEKVRATGYSGYTTWSLTDTGVLRFSGEGGMKNYTYKSEMPWYSYINDITKVVIEDGVTTIGNYAFYGMPNLTTVEIADTVYSIGDYAFKNCTCLDGVMLPSELTKLGESSFYACTSLSAIDIPEYLYTIRPYTFKNCTSLKSVTFHEGNLQKISDAAFYNTALTEVTLPDCLDILDVYVFKNCSKLVDIKLSSSLTQIREASLYGTAISYIEIPEGVTKIGPYAFKNCTNLAGISLPTTLISVGEASFYACTALKELVLPDAVTTIGNYAFRKCEKLTAVDFSENLENIGESSFYGCTALTTLVIPGNVTEIQGYAFKGCTGLKEVSLPDSLIKLGESVFYGCDRLQSIVIPAKVTRIGDYAFSRCGVLELIEFTGDAPSIGSGAFSKVTATAYYPADNTTWTAEVMQNYGGTVTWAEK